jgi:hypothetical protein
MNARQMQMKDRNPTVIALALLALAHLAALHLVHADQLTMLTDFGLPKSASPSQFIDVNGTLFFVVGWSEWWRATARLPAHFESRRAYPAIWFP